MQNNFINSFTHELKTPVTSLKLFLETFLKHDLGPAERQRCLGYMLADIGRSGLGDMDRAALEALLHQARGTWSGIVAARKALAGLENPDIPVLPDLDPPYRERVTGSPGL